MNLVEEQTGEIIKMQEELGIDIITSGEWQGIIMFRSFPEKIGGVRLFS